MATRYFVSFDGKDAADLAAASGDGFFEISGIEFGFENLTGAGPSIKSFDFQLDDGLFDNTVPSNLIDGSTFNLKVFAFTDVGENAPLTSKLILSAARVERFDTRAENGSINQFVSVVSNKIEWETNLFDVAEAAAGSKKLVIDRASNLPPEFTDTAGANAITTALSEANGGTSLDGLRYYMQFSTGGRGAGRATTVTEIDGFDFELSRQINLDSQARSQSALEFGTLTVTRSADEASSLFALLEKQQVTGGKVDIFAVGNVSGQGQNPKFDVVATYEFANGTINGAQAIVEDAGLSGINEGKHDVIFNFNALKVVPTKFKAGEPAGNVPYKAELAAASAANFIPPAIDTINLEETTGELANLPAAVAGNDSIVYLMGAKAGVSTIIDGQSEISLSNASTIGIGSGDLFEILDFEIDLDALTLKVTLPEAGVLSGFMKAITTTDYTVEVAAVSTTEDKILTSVVLDGAFIASIDTDYSSNFRENNGVAERVITFALPTDPTTGLPNNPESEFKLVQTRAVTGGEQNSEFKVTDAGATLTGQGSIDPLLTPIGGTLFLPAGEAVRDQDQQVFMQIKAIGNGADDGQTEWVEIDSFDHELGLSAATNGAVSGGSLFVSRVMDDATAKLMQVMAKGLDVEVHIEIYDEFGSTWANVAHYKFTDAQISSVSTSGTGGSASEGDFMREDLGIVFGTYEEVFVNRNIVDGAGLPTGSSAGSRVTLNQQSPSVTFLSGVTNEANIDTATGRLTLPSVSNDFLTTQSGGGADGLKMFLAVDGVDSGDGEQNVHFDAFDQFFSVNSYEFEGSGTGAFAFSGFDVEVSNAQNWVALDKLARDAQVAGGPSGEVNVRLIAADHGAEGGGGAGDANVVWEVDVTLATFEGVETSLGQSRAFRVNFADETDFAFKVRDSPTGNRTNSTEFTADFDLSGSGGFTGLGFRDVGYSESPARGGSNVPAGNIKDIGAAWAAGFQAGGTFSDDYRIFMNLKETADPEDFFEITQYSFNPLAEGDDRILEITGGLTDQSVADAFQVASGNTLPNAVQIEVYGENERLQGLIEYAFEGVTFTEQSSSIDNVSGTSVLRLEYTEFQEALAQYDNFGALSDLNVNGGNRMYASDGSVDLALFGGAADSFDAADNPIIVQAAGGSSGFSGSGGSGGAIGNDTPAPANAFLQLSAAIDAADAGDTVDIQNALAVGLGGTSVDKNNLTFNVAAGLNAVLGMSNITQLNLSGDGSGTVTGSSGNNTINGGDGDDVLDGGFGNDTLNGGEGDDTLTDGFANTNSGVDTLNGDGGDDVINVPFADVGDVYNGGTGFDTLDISLEAAGYANVALNAAGFQEFGANFTNFEHFNGSRFNDVVQGFGAGNVVNGNGGDDILSGGGGADVLDGGAGVDTLNGAAGDDILRDIETDPLNPSADTLNGGADNDTIIISGASTGDSYDGGTETDILDASAEVKAFTGADAADLSGTTFNAFGATFANFEHFIGTAFDDQITGGAATTQLEGRNGDDVIVGGTGNETILGGGNDDDITDGIAGNSQGVDQISGEGGNDIIRVFFGSFGETYDGGEDTDTIDVSGDTVSHTIDFSGTDAEYSLFGATFRNFENVIGTSAADTITGSDIANEINGGGGADIINAGDGADILIDDDANNGDRDTINGQDGDDIFRVRTLNSGEYDGGDGNDTIDLRINPDEYSGAEAIDLAAASFSNGSIFTDFENAFGSIFGDDIIGSADVNVLDGHTGADDIDGGGGDDIITDQDSNADTINGGADNDLIIVHNANGDTYDGGAGFDTLDLSNETQTYSGATGIVLGGAFTGPNGSSFDGFEKLIGTAQVDEVTGSGNDDLEVDAGDGDDVVTAASGNDTLIDSDTSGIDTLSGQAGDDTIIVRQANTDEIYDGGADNDTLDLSSHLFGFDATNPLDLTGAGAAIFQNFETVLATGESDTIIGSGVGQTIRAGGGLDNVTGGAGDDVIKGGIGGDTLNGGGGANTLSYEGSTEGVEVILGSNAVSGGDADGDKISNFVNVTGGAGDDVIFGQNVANVINGGGGDDQLHGNFGSNTVNGGAGDDTLFFFEDEFDRTQTDIWDGDDDGAKGDTGDFSGFHSAVTINLGLADEATTRDGVDVKAATGALRVIAQIDNVEHFVGSAFADTLAGGLGVNQLDGGVGNDLLIGRGGDDILNGGAGVDRLNGQLGADTMTGGADSDVYDVDNVGDVVIEEAGGGNADRVNTVVDFTNAGNIEFIVGKFAPIGLTIVGAGGIDRITGANKISFGDDISGEGGNDKLIALVGNDDIDGGGGNDRIFGNSGDDTITGGTGNDRVTGNQGADTFIHRIGDNNDTITDFNVNADILDLIAHGFSNFAEVMALATDITPGVRIDLAGADSILLQGVTKAAIGAEDILIV